MSHIIQYIISKFWGINEEGLYALKISSCPTNYITGCLPGKYGTFCDKNCPGSCDGQCDRQSGHCLIKCEGSACGEGNQREHNSYVLHSWWWRQAYNPFLHLFWYYVLFL